MRLISLNHIVRDICIVQFGDVTMNRFVRVARAAKWALQQTELHFMPAAALNSVWLEVADNYTIQLPADAVVVTKVGLLTTRGLVPLMYDDKIRAVASDLAAEEPLYCECDEAPVELTVVPETADYTNTFYNVSWDRMYGEIYAAGNGLPNAVSWRHNRAAGVLEFSSGWIDSGYKVLIEYKSAGAEGGEVIPIEAVPAIKAYVLYELFLTQPNLARAHMEEFRRQARMLKSLYVKTDVLAIMNAFLHGQVATPK